MAVIEAIIASAKRAPFSMNTQPWHVHVPTGSPLEEMRRRNMKEMMGGILSGAAEVRFSMVADSLRRKEFDLDQKRRRDWYHEPAARSEAVIIRC